MSSPKSSTDTHVAEASVNAAERQATLRALRSEIEKFDAEVKTVLMKNNNEEKNAPVQKAPTSAQQEVPSAQPRCQWNMTHCCVLVYELVTRVFQGKKGPEYAELFRYLIEHFSERHKPKSNRQHPQESGDATEDQEIQVMPAVSVQSLLFALQGALRAHCPDRLLVHRKQQVPDPES